MLPSEEVHRVTYTNWGDRINLTELRLVDEGVYPHRLRLGLLFRCTYPFHILKVVLECTGFAI